MDQISDQDTPRWSPLESSGHLSVRDVRLLISVLEKMVATEIPVPVKTVGYFLFDMASSKLTTQRQQDSSVSASSYVPTEDEYPAGKYKMIAKQGATLNQKRESILEEAIRLTSQDRQAIYGHPRDHFKKTIGLVNAMLSDYLKKPLESEQWPKIMICDKLARSMNSYKRDNMADIAGYAQTHEMVVE